jgi:hypothetical protein
VFLSFGNLIVLVNAAALFNVVFSKPLFLKHFNMKTLFTLLCFSLSTTFFAQTHVMVKHNGEKINVNYIKTNNNLIYFNSGKDQVEQTISTFAVAELINTTNNEATKVSDKITVNGEQDYNKVVVIPSAASSGLATSKNTLVANRIKGQTPLAVQQQNLVTLKRKAAKEGLPFVSLDEKNRAESSATMYTY